MQVNFDSFVNSWAMCVETIHSYSDDALFPWPHMHRLRTDLCDVGPNAPTNSDDDYDEDIGRHSPLCDSYADVSLPSRHRCAGARTRVFNVCFACQALFAY